ncbi:MAG TPA: FlgD immunoglobulin-like domain containing protein [bacterium]
MTKYLLCIQALVLCSWAQVWTPFGEQNANYEWHSAVFTPNDFDDCWSVGFNNSTSKGRIERRRVEIWPIPDVLNQNYLWHALNTRYYPDNKVYFGGYKNNQPDIYKGRFCYRAAYYGDFYEISLPYPYNQPGLSTTPVISISMDDIAGHLMVTGGNGMILFYDVTTGQWITPQTHPYPDDESDWYDGTWTMDGFMVCGDNSGKIYRTTNLGSSWEPCLNPSSYPDNSFPRDYYITDYGVYHGALTPLSVPHNDCRAYYAGMIGFNYGNIAKWNEGPPPYYTIHNVNPNADTVNSKWWWFTGTSGQCYLYDPPPERWHYFFSGGDGIILRWDPDNPQGILKWWERYLLLPYANDSTYWLTGIGFTLEVPSGVQRWTVGTKGQFMKATDIGGTETDPPSPTGLPDMQQCLNLQMPDDPIFGGFRMIWQPPANSEVSKVAAYWVCPPEDPRWIANKAPIMRTNYLLPWAKGRYLDARVAAMRRDGKCGPWTPLVWVCTLDRLVDDQATGKNNARRIVYGADKLWAFWQKDGMVYMASSEDSGKYWTYRESQEYLGSGKWPAASVTTAGLPVVCWLENLVNGSQVTSRIWYSQYSYNEWTDPTMVKEETYQGNGYLYPAISCDQANHIHIVYGKQYNDYQNWQLWYGEFPYDNPGSVSWHMLDSYAGTPNPGVQLSPTIGTTKYDMPMVAWNRPNSSTQYFGYRDLGIWYTQALSFTGTMPCLEVLGTTAYLTYVNSSDIWYAVGGITGFGKPKRICTTLGNSSSPCIANNVIVWQEQINDDHEIYYSHLTAPDIIWSPPAKLFGYSYLPDEVPQIVWVHPFAFVEWTQGQTNKVVAYNRQVILSREGDGVASFAYDLGDSVPAPVLIARTGFNEYGAEPAKTVDMSSGLLQYRIDGLGKCSHWKAQLSLYHEAGHPVPCRIKLGMQNPIIVTLPSHQIINRTFTIPESLIVNDALDLALESTNGDNVTMGGMLFFATPKPTGGGPQSMKTIHIPSTLNITCLPNPLRDNTFITYNLPDASPIKIAVYNSTGSLIKTIEQGTCEPGIYHNKWNARDTEGNRVPSGIYFIKLETPNTTMVKKAVVIR